MELAIQLYGYLILTFLGVIAPVLLVLLSMFREGTLKLATQYENEKFQSEKNIKEQLKKIGEAEKTDVTEIEQSLTKLKAIKKTAETKLSCLNPKEQTFRLFLPLLISFLGVILAILTKNNIPYIGLFIAISLICFTYAIVILWKLLGIIIEVRKTIDDDKKDIDMKTIELLSLLVEQQAQHFLKAVYITINNRRIKDNTSEITIIANEKQELKFGVINTETRMAKSVQIGFTFPPDFIIEKTGRYLIYTGETDQIVRYTAPLIHGDTHLILRPIIITPLKEGIYNVRTFIKAENIEAIYRDLTLKVEEEGRPF